MDSCRSKSVSSKIDRRLKRALRIARPYPLNSMDRYTVRLRLRSCRNLFIHTRSRCRKVAIGHAINEVAIMHRPSHFRIRRSIRSAWGWAEHVIVNSRFMKMSGTASCGTFDELKHLPFFINEHIHVLCVNIFLSSVSLYIHVY